MRNRRILSIVGVVVLAAAVVIVIGLRRSRLVLTGIVTTDEVIVSSEIQGRLQRLAVDQGDTVKRGQLLGVISPAEWRDDLAFYENGERGAAAQVSQAEASLRYQEELTGKQVQQEEANLAAIESQVSEAEADLDFARLNFERQESLHRQGAVSVQDYDRARTTYDGANAHVESLRKQVASAQAALDLAKAGATVVAERRAALAASREQLAAAAAQKEKAGVRLGYTEIRAPIDGVVDQRAALQGEVVNPGQAIITLINPDNLWIRADVEESYIDRIHLGDKYTVRMPSGSEREGTVYFRGVDADYATQRDVSRTKRDIKTFEVRLRCGNQDQSLAVGMTAYVILPFAK